MKKIFYSIIVAGLALVSAACQKLDEQIITPGASNDLTVTASIVNFDGTKVSYAFTDPENSKSGIKPSWVENDEIFGFDDKGGTFSFSVEDIDDNGKATFSTTGYSPAEGVTKLYAVYYPGKSVSDLENDALSVDLSSQSGTLDGNAPAIMCATGTIKNNIVNFAFTNQTAVVGIYKMQVYKNGAALATSSITGVSLGNVLTQGTIKLEGGEFKLYPGEPHGTISAENLNLTTDGEGCVEVSSPSYTYFAVIPEENASITVNASDEMTSYKTNASITGKINAGSYYYLGKKIYGGVVATVGGNSYATVSEAFAAATGGQTIQLQNDCDFDSQITLADKSGEITLDLNGCTLTNGPTSENKIRRFYLNEENATLIIQDSKNDGGKITSGTKDQDIIRIIEGNLKVVSGTIEAPAATDGGNAAIWVKPATSGAETNASVIVTGGKILGPATVSTADKRAYALYVENPGAEVSVSGGEFSAQSNNLRIMDAKSVDITGGTFTCEASEYTLRFASSKAAGEGYTCNISGDATSVTSASRAVYAYGEGLTLNISGGKFKTTGTGAIILAETGKDAELPVMNITGGLYSKAPNSDYVAENYVCLNNTDQATKGDYPKQVKEFSAVATLTVGEGTPVEFASVEDAVAEANKDGNKETACTITLTAPSTVGAQAVISNTAGVTLDLNDQTLQFGGTDRIYVAKNSSLTIVDNGTNKTGTITQNATGSNTISLTNAGSSLTISGGKITCAEGQTSATVYVTDGTLTMDGGEITGIKVGISMASDKGSAPEVTVSGNAKVTSTGSNAIVPGAGKLTIDGGYFKASAAVIYTTSTSITDYVASGGYYNKALDERYITVKEGYVCVSEPDDSRPDYDYVVKEFSAVATLTVGGTATEFASVEDAVAEANKATQACIITLTASSTVGAAATVTNSDGVTLDLNGKTLTHDESNRIGLSGSGKLTITDGSTGGTITQTAAGSSTITYSSGTLTIAGGTITKEAGSTYYTIYVSGGNLYVNGGTITNNASGYATIAVSSDSEKGTSGTAEISGGTVTSSGQSAISVTGTGDLTVTEGEIESTVNAANKHAINLGAGTGTVNISGGNIHAVYQAINFAANSEHQVNLSGECVVTSTNTNAMIGRKDSKAVVTVTGGKYKSGESQVIFSNASGASTTYSVKECKFNGPDILANRLAPFYRNADNTDSDSAEYPRKVEYFAPVTLAIGSGEAQPYASVETAVEQANKESQACKITLNDDLTVDTGAEVTNSQGVTLDLNGKTLTTGASPKRIGVSGDGVLTIDDSASGGNITISAETQVFNYYSGEVILNKGTITGKTSYYPVKVTGSGKFTINGGEITSPGGTAIYLEGANAKVTLNNGGTLSGAHAAGTVRANQGTFEMNGGTITSSKVAVQVNGEVNCSIKGGTITSTATDTCAIYINHNDADVTVNGSDVVITGSKRYGSSVVWLNNGTFTLKNGTIGNIIGTLGSTDGSTNRNHTAVRVVDGTFNMEGGLLVARQSVIQFGKRGGTDSASGNGTATITGGRMVNGANGWQLVQFRTNTENKLTVNNDACLYLAGSSADVKMFTGNGTKAEIPTTASVTINGGHFNRDPQNITNVTVNGTVYTDTRTIDELSYNYHVE